MTLGDLLFLITVFCILISFIILIVALLRRKMRLARNTLLGIFTLLCIYTAALIGVSLLTPQTDLTLHQEHCFDEMCFSVTRVNMAKAVGRLTTAGAFYIVTVQLRNAALGTPQKPDSPSFVLVDAQGHSYNPSQVAQQAIGQQPVWNNRLQPGEIQSRDVIFEVPGILQQPGLIVSEGSWPTSLIIGDENSPFHQKTLIRLGNV